MRDAAAMEADRLLMGWGESLLSAEVRRNPVAVYVELLEGKYRELRQAVYARTKRDDPKITKTTSGDTSSVVLIKKSFLPDWHARGARALVEKGVLDGRVPVDTVYLNAYADPQLIRALDDFLIRSGVHAVYKTPASFEHWLDRHDPVTFYFLEPLTPEIEAELARITQSFVRSPDGLFGRNIGGGLSVNTQPTAAELKDMLDRAEQLDPKLADALRKKFVNSGRRPRVEFLRTVCDISASGV